MKEFTPYGDEKKSFGPNPNFNQNWRYYRHLALKFLFKYNGQNW